MKINRVLLAAVAVGLLVHLYGPTVALGQIARVDTWLGGTRNFVDASGWASGMVPDENTAIIGNSGTLNFTFSLFPRIGGLNMPANQVMVLQNNAGTSINMLEVNTGTIGLGVFERNINSGELIFRGQAADRQMGITFVDDFTGTGAGLLNVDDFGSVFMNSNYVESGSGARVAANGRLTISGNTQFEDGTTLNVLGDFRSAGFVAMNAAVNVESGGDARFDSLQIDGGTQVANRGTSLVDLETHIINGELGLESGVFQTGSVVVGSAGRLDLEGGRLHVTGMDGLNTLTIGNLNVGGGSVVEVDHVLKVSPGTQINITDGGLVAQMIQLDGAQIHALAGQSIDLTTSGPIHGFGSITAAVVGDETTSIVASGDLLVGQFSDPNAIELGGTLDVGSHHVALIDADEAHLGVMTTLETGRISSLNGLVLESGDVLTASGPATVDGALTNNGSVQGPGTEGEFLSFGDTVDGGGDFAGNIAFLGEFSPGSSPGQVTIDGDVRLGAGSHLRLELGEGEAGVGHDHLKVTGTLEASGELLVVLLDGYVPALHDTFDLLDIQRIEGAFHRITLPTFSNGLAFDDSALLTTGQLRVVPEPGSLIGLALVGWIGLSRRRGAKGRFA